MSILVLMNAGTGCCPQQDRNATGFFWANISSPPWCSARPRWDHRKNHWSRAAAGVCLAALSCSWAKQRWIAKQTKPIIINHCNHHHFAWHLMILFVVKRMMVQVVHVLTCWWLVAEPTSQAFHEPRTDCNQDWVPQECQLSAGCCGLWIWYLWTNQCHGTQVIHGGGYCDG